MLRWPEFRPVPRWEKITALPIPLAGLRKGEGKNEKGWGRKRKEWRRNRREGKVRVAEGRKRVGVKQGREYKRKGGTGKGK